MERTPEQLEALVLSSLTTVERLAAAMRAGLTADAFQVDAHRQAFERGLDALKGGRALPSPADLREAGVEVTEEVEDYEHYVAGLVRAFVAGRSYAVLQRHVPALSGEEPVSAIREIVSGLSGLLGSVSVHVGETDAEAGERLEVLRAQREIVEQGGTLGIPTGLPIFDDVGLDWRPGELVAILGYSGIGKSWLLDYFCCRAYLAGKKVLFLTPEDSKHEVGLRTDVVLSHLVEEQNGETWGFTFTSLNNAAVDLDRYREWAEKFALRSDWVTVDAGTRGSFSVEDVLAMTREHRPDVLAINGFHMLATERGHQSWERMFEAGRLVKGLVQDLGITAIAVTQARRDAGVVPDSPPEPHDVAYGHGIVESADRVISMGKARGQALRRSFTVPKFRNGPEVHTRHYLEFDVDRGHIRQVVKKKGD